jgi:flavin-dependent dehydrogenase
MIADVERVGRLHSTGNYSYRATRSSGASHIKVGDAYGFIDPIFSTGVHIALLSAREAAKAVGTILAKPGTRTAQLATYHRKFERHLSYISWLIYQINDPAFRHLMVNPRNLFGIEQAIISLLAGDFRRDPRIRMRVALFKMIHYMVRLSNPA